MSAMLPRLFDDSVFVVFDPFADFGRGHNRVFGKHASHLMKTDIRETDSSYKFSIDLPGFKKEDVSAELKDGYLTVTAVKSHQDEEKNEEGKLIRQERYSGSCSRTFYVGESVDEKDCKAGFEDGILTIEVPKQPEHQEPAKRMITIA